MGEEHDLSTVLGSEDSGEEYTDLQFTNYLGADDLLYWQKFGVKRVFWAAEAYEKSPIIQNKITILVREGTFGKCLIQFWAPIVVRNRRYLRTSDQPFAVDGLYKGMCWYRKHCMDRGDILVDYGANEEQLGAVGRVFLNGYPESSPDLRLYSAKELPLRDDAARCGARQYFVLPIFDLLKKECYGVLECLGFCDLWMGEILDCIGALERALEKAELRTTHLKTDTEDLIEEAQEMVPQLHMPRDEIAKMLEAAKEMVPQLHMAQVWIPCRQCANTTVDLCCMELVDSITRNQDDYLDASNFHRLQPQKGIIAKTVMSSPNFNSSFCRNICNFSHSENLLAHYAQKSRLSFCFAICLESVHNSDDLCYLEFFLEPNSRQDPSGVSLCHLLIGLMEKILRIFMITSSDMLEVHKDMVSNSIEFDHHNISGSLEGEKHPYSKETKILTKMNRYLEMYPSELEFLKYLQMDDHFSCFNSRERDFLIWLFWCPEREELRGIEETTHHFCKILPQ